MALSLTNAAANALATDFIADIGASAKINIYDGTPPANAGTALSGNNLLATITGPDPFGTASNGVITAGTLTDDSSADATGTATFFRILTSGDTVLAQGTVGTSGADLNLNSTSIVAAGIVRVTSLTITIAGA